MYQISVSVNVIDLNALKLVLPVIFTIYEVAHNTKKDPSCVHIKKYNEACVPRL